LIFWLILDLFIGSSFCLSLPVAHFGFVWISLPVAHFGLVYR